MEITNVRIRLTQKDDIKLKAIASLTFDDCFVIHEVRVLESEKGVFIAMPSRKGANGEFRDIAHPINSETREKMEKAIIEAYEKAKNEPRE